ncbi:hypothetical protein D9M68_631700 [compost metagenome]
MVGVVAHAFAQRVFGDRHVVVLHVGEPVDHFAAAVEARAARRVAGGQVNLAPGQVQVFGDLRTRLAAAHHQHSALGQLRRVAVLRRVVLRHVGRQLLGQPRHYGAVVAAGSDHHLVGGVEASVGLHHEAVSLTGAGDACHTLDGDAFDGRRLHMRHEARKPFVDLLLDHESVRIVAEVTPAGQLALPVGRDQAERIPALRAPAVHEAALLDHEVVDAALLQAMAQGEAGLAAADDDDAVVAASAKWIGHGVFFLSLWM